MKLNFNHSSQSVPPMPGIGANAMAFSEAPRNDFKDEAASVIENVLSARPDGDPQVDAVDPVGVGALLNRHPICGG